MDIMQILPHLFAPITQPILLVYIGVAVFLGVYIGAVPGLSVTMAASLLISFTYSWDVLPAMAAMVGVYVGGVYGGSRSAILLNIPGAPAAIATGLDGYPLAQKGLAGAAIGATVMHSFIGGIVGTLILLFGAPAMADLAIKFGSRDYFLLTIMGLMLVGSLSPTSTWRGLFAAALGLLVGSIGMDSFTGHARLNFGNTYLLNGVSYVVVMIGLFGMSEALVQMRDIDVVPVKQKLDRILPRWSDVTKHLWLSFRCSLLGTFVGALPGTGGDIAALMAYDHAKRSTKNPETPFGEGAVEGIVAPEAANNAAIGGACIPMLTLGIPGDAVTAIMIGAMFIHGLQPGPMLMTQSADVFWFIVGGMFVANLFLLLCGFTGIKLFAKIVEVPKYILMPIIIILSVVGAFSINNSITDVYWMLAFGVFGYFLKMYDIPIGPTILGVILSSLLELNYRRGMALAHNSVFEFFLGFFKSPITIVLLCLLVFMLVSQSPRFTEAMDKLKEKVFAKKAA